jgi:hypothetical protein
MTDYRDLRPTMSEIHRRDIAEIEEMKEATARATREREERTRREQREQYSQIDELRDELQRELPLCGMSSMRNTNVKLRRPAKRSAKCRPKSSG